MKFLDNVITVSTARLVIVRIETDALRDIVTDGKITLCAGVSKALTTQVKADDLVKYVSKGNHPNLTQTEYGCKKLLDLLDGVKDWVGAKPVWCKIKNNLKLFRLSFVTGARLKASC